jgi:hypothetical protein
MEVRIRSGSVTLDFTRAQVTWPTLQIDADVRSGSLTLIAGLLPGGQHRLRGQTGDRLMLGPPGVPAPGGRP